MDAETEIAHLKAKLAASEAVHAALIGTLANVAIMVAGAAATFVKDDELLQSVTTEKLLQGVRECIHIKGGDAVLTLVFEQHVEDVIHHIEHVMRSMDRGRSDQ